MLLEIQIHRQLHKDMNDYMRQQTDANGNHMRPQRGNPGARIRENFTPAQRQKAVGDFYKGPGAKYKNAARDFFEQIKKLR